MPVAPPPAAKKIAEGQLLSYYQWEQELLDGSKTTFECITRPDTVTVLAFRDRNTVILTEQVQPTKSFTDLPGGRVDQGEDMEAAVKRELEEETGLRAQTWLEVSHMRHNGVVRYEQAMFLAADLEHGTAHLDPGEKITVKEIPWAELVNICLEGGLRQTSTMFTILQMEYSPSHRKNLQDFLDTAFGNV